MLPCPVRVNARLHRFGLAWGGAGFRCVLKRGKGQLRFYKCAIVDQVCPCANKCLYFRYPPLPRFCHTFYPYLPAYPFCHPTSVFFPPLLPAFVSYHFFLLTLPLPHAAFLPSFIPFVPPFLTSHHVFFQTIRPSIFNLPPCLPSCSRVLNHRKPKAHTRMRACTPPPPLLFESSQICIFSILATLFPPFPSILRHPLFALLLLHPSFLLH
eukprot:jgi/Botrbrau1/23371/Bobra.0051s0023.1